MLIAYDLDSIRELASDGLAADLVECEPIVVRKLFSEADEWRCTSHLTHFIEDTDNTDLPINESGTSFGYGYKLDGSNVDLTAYLESFNSRIES